MILDNYLQKPFYFLDFNNNNENKRLNQICQEKFFKNLYQNFF